MQAHWPALVAADFFTTQVDRARAGDVLHRFVLQRQSRRVQVIGCTPYSDEAVVIQCLRHVRGETSGLLREGRILLCDHDPKCSRGVEGGLAQLVFAWFGRRRARRTAPPIRSGSSGPRDAQIRTATAPSRVATNSVTLIAMLYTLRIYSADRV